MTRSPGQNGAIAKSFSCWIFLLRLPDGTSLFHFHLSFSPGLFPCLWLPQCLSAGEPQLPVRKAPHVSKCAFLLCVCAGSSSSEPFQSGSSFPCGSILFLSKPGVGRLLSAVQDPRVGVPAVELDSLAPQTKALCFCNPSLLPSLPPDLKPHSGWGGATSLPLSPFSELPLVVEAVVQVPGPLQRDSLHMCL